MAQLKFDADNGVNTPKKILDAGPRGGFVAIQVLDASTLYFDVQRDVLELSGAAFSGFNAASHGFQVKTANGLILMWWKGEMWGRSDTPGAIINAAILFKIEGKNGVLDQAPPLTDEL
jgi:hypothetical protein